MRANLLSFLFLAIAASSISSCDKQTEDFETEQINDYLNLQPGKYITYRLDSTVFLQQGRREETHSYQERHVVDALRTDNLGRPSYRIFRYLRDTAGTETWKPAGSYFITPLRNTMEVIENNLRVVRLALPIKKDESWKGNRFLPNNPYGPAHGDEFNNDDNMFDWDFTVDNTDETITLNGKTINNVITVKHVDEAANAPVTDPNTYGFMNYSEDKFAKGLGLVYQRLIMWEYQVIPGGPSPYKVGFGVKRSMIDHN